MGFEPMVRLPVHTLSKRAPSATRTLFPIPVVIITLITLLPRGKVHHYNKAKDFLEN